MIKSSFVLLIFIISGCAASSLKFVPQSDVEKKEQKQNVLIFSSTEDSENSGIEITNEGKPTAGNAIERRTFAEKAEDKLEEIEENNFEEFKISKRLDKLKNATSQLTAKKVEIADGSNDSSNDKNGTGFFIAGLIFAILSLVFFLRSMVVTETEDSIQGCTMAAMEMIGWILLAAIFGVIALMFLIIGLTIFIAKRQDKAI